MDNSEIDLMLQLAHMHPADRASLIAQRAANNVAGQPAAIPAGAPMASGSASQMETAIREKAKAAQAAKLQQLLQQRGVAAAAPPPMDQPVIRGNAGDIIQ